MRTLKKCIAFMLAVGLMISAMTVFASDSSSSGSSYIYNTSTNISVLDGGNYRYSGDTEPTSCNSQIAPKEGDVWTTSDGASRTYRSGYWAGGSSCDAAPVVGPAPLTGQEIAEMEAHAESAAVQGAAYDEGFTNVGDMYRAAEKSMSAGEYYNNVVTNTPGIENAITIGQGGNLVVNGEETNMTATISKVTNRAYVDSIRIEQEGTVLNVVDVQFPAVEATINFYTPGVADGVVIEAYRYDHGLWVDLEVVEVRADHVILNMQGSGVVAFIAK